MKERSSDETDDWLAIFSCLFVLRQLVFSWGIVFRLTRVTRRNYACQVRGTRAGRARHGHGREGEAISPVHNTYSFPLSHILIVLFCLFVCLLIYTTV